MLPFQRKILSPLNLGREMCEMNNGISMVKLMIISSFGWGFMIQLIIADKAGADQNKCNETRCGEDQPPIRFPFRLQERQPAHCGFPGFNLTCTNWNETVLELPNVRMKFLVYNIDYEFQYMNVYSYADECWFQKQNLESLSLLISPFQFYSAPYDYGSAPYDYVSGPYDYGSAPYDYGSVLFNCSANQTSANLLSRDFDIVPCLSNHRHVVLACYYNTDLSRYLWNLVSCRKIFEMSTIPRGVFTNKYYITLTWSIQSCELCEALGERCRLKKHATGIEETECYKLPKAQKGRKGALIAGIVCSSLVLVLVATAIFHVYTIGKKERESHLRIKKILEDYRAFRPSRFTYADVKRITNQFNEKLGEGAYGTVFKGKLSNEFPVAVKILNNSKGNGEEFINEVATMGQIHHVNVVRLVGYCAEGFRRALIYEFLPNDSLDKYLSSAAGGTNRSLSWETLQGIALGIAKGIEYLHQGCDQRILHFDIKPHNILLDLNFIPKVSDFGLAKLCSKDQSLVSMSTARGTMGYIAPEVFSRNFGNVSYKSDVYSFGMLLLEMVGGRKNTNETVDNTEEIYYPEWIYNLLEEGEDLRIHIEGEGDAKLAKKLAIVGLWCIQWHPTGRPTMKAVIRMLEAEDDLTMPPNPFASMGPSKTNKKVPTRRMALELEAIAE